MDIGLVKETKARERRVALIPEHVGTLISHHHQVFVEENAGVESGFSNQEYERCGAKIVSTAEVYQQPLIIRVKEPLLDTIRKRHVIMGYFHIEKGQNPPLLHKLLQNQVTAYAYEEIRDPKTGLRKVNLGFEAGVVGMFEGLRTYGAILKNKGQEDVFKDVKPLVEYADKGEAYLALRDIDPRRFIAKVCIAGYGKVSKGAQEVLAQLSHPPIILREEETIRATVLGQNYVRIRDYLPTINIFVNAVVWKPGQPRIIERGDLGLMLNRALIVDISCDANGGVETCTPTTWENPTYTVKTNNGKIIIHSCVDNLPSALAHDSSITLSRAIIPYVLRVADGEELETGLVTKEGKFVFNN